MARGRRKRVSRNDGVTVTVGMTPHEIWKRLKAQIVACSSRSEELYNMSLRHYWGKGRGALVMHYPDTESLMSPKPEIELNYVGLEHIGVGYSQETYEAIKGYDVFKDEFAIIATFCGHEVVCPAVLSKAANQYLDERLKATICSHCRGHENLQRCARCRKVSYCSRECQRLHWRVHRHECERSP